jgi:hypothetical protein
MKPAMSSLIFQNIDLPINLSRDIEVPKQDRLSFVFLGACLSLPAAGQARPKKLLEFSDYLLKK